ncbi:MAG: ArsR/SmtB family transcription factor [bacterium]
MRVISLLPETETPSIEVDYGNAYEFLLSLCAFTRAGPDVAYDVGPQWFERAGARASRRLLDEVRDFCQGFPKLWGHLLGLVYTSAGPKSVPAFLTQLQQTDALELSLHLLGYYLQTHRGPTPLEVVYLAAQGDHEASERLLATSFPEDATWRAVLGYLLRMGQKEIKRRLTGVLNGWYEQVFRHEELAIAPMLETDARAKREMRQTVPLEQIIQLATNGIEYAPEPGIRKIVLVPTWILRPWNLITEYRDTKIFCYPVASYRSGAGASEPPDQLTRLIKALADETRLQVLRLLGTDSHTLQELSEHLQLAKSTVHHHLAILRAAGLLAVVEGEEKRYKLNPHRIAGVSAALADYVGK